MIKTLRSLVAVTLFSVTLAAHADSSAISHFSKLAQALHSQAANISTAVIAKGILAYRHAKRRHLARKPVITVVDYSLPSDRKRLMVANLATRKVLYYTYVAHGRGSGLRYATHFSNASGSKASSLGVFLTGRIYNGEHGYSLRLKGLNPVFNGHAYQRDIVVHAADYVSKAFAKKYGRMGRSWGCFTLSAGVEHEVVGVIRGGSILMAYYPDRKWLQESPFLKPIRH